MLGWHSIEASWCFPRRRALSVGGFAWQVALLRRLANVVPLEDGLASLAEGRPLPPRAVALTFDDGYADTLTVVAPLLRRHRMPATFFVCPGLLERTVRPWWEVASWAIRAGRSPRVDWRGRRYSLSVPRNRRAAMEVVLHDLKETGHVDRDLAISQLVESCRPAAALDTDRLLLDWPGARRLVESGFTVGSHTVSHWILGQERETTQKQEVVEAREALADRLGIEAHTFCYPNGRACDFTGETMEIVANAGHRFAITTIPGRNDAGTLPWTVRRVMLDAHHGPAAFVALLDTDRKGARPLPAALRANKDRAC